MLNPSAEIGVLYDDNIFTVSEDTSDDAILTARGELDARSLWERHRLAGTAYVEQTLHAQYERENTLEGGAQLYGTYDISQEMALNASVGADFLAEDRARITSVGQALTPTRYSQLSASASLAYDPDPLQVTVDMLAIQLNFEDAETVLNQPIEQDFRDSLYLRGATSVAYDVSPRIAAVVRGQVDRLTYTNEGFSAPFDRDSTGYALEAGVRMELNNLLFGEIRAGVLHREPDEASFPAITGVSFGGNLSWSVTPLTTVQLFADRQVQEGGSASISGNLRSQVELKVEHELLRNLILEAEGHYASFEAIGAVDAEATEYAVELGAEYLVNRRLRLLARAGHFERSGDEMFYRSFSRNRVMVGARLVF